MAMQTVSVWCAINGASAIELVVKRDQEPHVDNLKEAAFPDIAPSERGKVQVFKADGDQAPLQQTKDTPPPILVDGSNYLCQRCQGTQSGHKAERVGQGWAWCR
eukprot:1706930-Amphidinium_carterae.1